MKKSSPGVPLSPSWDTVLLVCKACRRRRQAPKELKNRAMLQATRRLARGLAPKPRIVPTGCLGLCPKAATAVALIGAGRPARIIAVHSLAELDGAIPALIGGEPGSRRRGPRPQAVKAM